MRKVNENTTNPQCKLSAKIIANTFFLAKGSSSRSVSHNVIKINHKDSLYMHSETP